MSRLTNVLVWCLILTYITLPEATRSATNNNHSVHRHHIIHHENKTNNIYHQKNKYHVTDKLPSDPDHTRITKKAEIERAVKNLEDDQHKDKRGFLANLANLLNDAEAISGHKDGETGLSSVTLSDKISSNNIGKIPAPITAEINPPSSNNEKIPSTSNSPEIKSVETSKKEEIVPSADDVQKALKGTTKDFAPIFAMLHGKIIPLGKLPDSAFKKSRTEQPPEQIIKLENRSEVKETIEAQKISIPKSSSVDEKKKNSEVTKLSKLQQYLTNLDGHTPATGSIKNVKGSVKDQVTFPEEETGSTKSEILSHVKGVVLDNGKVVSVNNNHIDYPEESKQITDSDTQQKFIVSDDGSLTPLTKGKTEIGESVVRDTTGGTEGQKTVALSLDVLKDLLKKNDNKISLASLLNKNADTKSETNPPVEDDDPGTIEDFAAGGLKSHNMYRAKHHDDALIWSDDLSAKAQKLAESLADKKTLEIAKDLEKEGYGENVAKVWATFKNAGEAAAKMWYTQSENYRFSDPHLDENTGQFAQLIWKNTKELGMGVAKSIDDVNNKYVYVVALYRPPGNIEATLRLNVLPTGNNTVDVYTTFFKRAGVVTDIAKTVKRSKLPEKIINYVDEKD